MNRKGFVSVGVLLTMLLILTVASMGITSTTGLRKTYENTVKVRENYLLGENFVTYYQLFIAEKIKEVYGTLPYEDRYELEREELDKMNYRMFNYIYGGLTEKWYYEFKTAMMNENTNAYLGYELINLQMIKQRYNPITKSYEDHRLEVTDSDFRLSIKMTLLGSDGKRKELDTVVYFYIPSYDIIQQEQWLNNEAMSFEKEDFKSEILTRVGDTVVFG